MKNIAIIALVLALSSTEARNLQRVSVNQPRQVPQQVDTLSRARDSNHRAQNSLNRIIGERGERNHHSVMQHRGRDPAGDAAAKAEDDSGSDSGSDSDDGEAKVDVRKSQQQRLKRVMQDTKRESKRYKKFKPVKRDKDGKPVEQKFTDEELEDSRRYENPDRDYPHPTLGIKHKYIDMMRKFGGMDDPRRVKKEEEKKELLLQLGNDPIGSSIGITEYPLPLEPLGYKIDYPVPNFGVDPEVSNVAASIAETEKLMGQQFNLPDEESQKLPYKVGYTVPNFGADHDIANIKEAINQTEEKLDFKWNPQQDPESKAWIVPQPIDSSAYSYRA